MKKIQSLIFPEIKSNTSRSVTKIDQCKVNQLPPSALHLIFSYFTEDELQNNIIPVCQKWRDIAEEPTLWNTLKFAGNKAPLTHICDKIRQFNLANKIVIRYSSESKIILRQIARCNRNLTHLVLRHSSEVTEDSLRYLITTCKNLKILDLKGSPFKCLIFYEELIHARALEEVNFSENNFFSIKHIMTLVVNLNKLNGFHLSSFKPNDNVLLNDSDCYFMLTHTVFGLKRLTLDCSCLSGFTFSSICKCKNLEYLCLNYAFNLEGKSFENLWKTLKKIRTLKIRFAHNIKDCNMVGLFGNGKDVMKHLQVLDLTGCTQIGDQGLKALAECCTDLKSLVIRNCPKIICVESVLSKCTKLEVLNVAFCKNLCLDTQTVPEKLKEFFFSKILDQRNFAKLVKSVNPDTVIKLCQNEFNKFVIQV